MPRRRRGRLEFEPGEGEQTCKLEPPHPPCSRRSQAGLSPTYDCRSRKHPTSDGERRIFYHAALAAFSAIPASARKMPAAPLRRSEGVSPSSKKTTFMSG